MSLVEFSREKNYIAMLSDFIVLIDGIEICKIKNGKTEIFEIDEGLHSVKIKMNYLGYESQETSFEAKKSMVKFVAIINMRWWQSIYFKPLFYYLFKRCNSIVIKKIDCNI